MSSSIERFLEKISQISNAHHRGYKFQDLLRTLFNESRFEVDTNPATAKPRQSDLFASQDDKEYLIEAKWQKKKITSGDIDDLRVRLNRTPSGVVGCLFSMSDFTKNAIDAVESDKQRIILLFCPDEVRGLVRFRHGLEELLKRKRKNLMVAGKVWFSHQSDTTKTFERLAFPDTTRSIIQGGKVAPYLINANNDFGDALFAEKIPDITWGLLSGNGVGISIRLPEKTPTELRRFFALVHNQFGLSSEGSFSIHQSNYSWHGYGIDNFLTQVVNWKKRYEVASLNRIHHSEQICYFDTCETGYCLFSARQAVDLPRSHLDLCEFEIHLTGIPVNMAPFIRICEEAQYRKEFFVPFLDPVLDRVRLKEPIIVEPTGQIITNYEPYDETVSGLVIKNPFRKKESIPKGKLKYSAFNTLNVPGFLVCQLSDWHNPADIVDTYRMTHVEAVSIGHAHVFRCVGTWDNIIERGGKFKNRSLVSASDLARKYGVG